MLFALRRLLASHALDEPAFFILSTLSVRDRLTLEELNAIIGYTGFTVTPSQLASLEAQRYIAREEDGEALRFVLTADGREASLRQIAHAKAVEEDLVDKLGVGDVMALKLLLKRLIASTDPGLPDLWAPVAAPAALA